MPSANRNARITARFRERERELIEAAARHRGVHLSELVRKASLAAARQELTTASAKNEADEA